MAQEEPRLVAPPPAIVTPAASAAALLDLAPGALVTMWVEAVDPS